MAREIQHAVNVSLRPLSNTDVDWLDAWLSAVAQRVGYDATTGIALLARMEREPHLRLRVITRDDAPVGLLVYNAHCLDEGSAVFELIAIPPEHARRGAGMAAAGLAEEEMRSEGVTTVYAPAAATNGISMYFWIRLGYAPTMREASPCQREGVAWLKRSLT